VAQILGWNPMCPMHEELNSLCIGHLRFPFRRSLSASIGNWYQELALVPRDGTTINKYQPIFSTFLYVR
jgi:hypothetical protein